MHTPNVDTGHVNLCPVPGCLAAIPHGHQLCTIHDRSIPPRTRRELAAVTAGPQPAAEPADAFRALARLLADASRAAATN